MTQHSVLDAVEALVDHNLLVRSESDEVESRFRMLETVRDFAAGQLAESGDEGTMRRRHGEYFLALAEEAEPALTGPDLPRWLARLEADHDNLRAALAWAVEAGDGATAQRLAAALWRFWTEHGHLLEAYAWLERALMFSETAPILRAKVHHNLGNVLLDLGDYATAQEHLELGLTLRRAIEGQANVAYSLNGLGLVAYYRGDYEEARRLHLESLALSTAANDALRIANSLSNLGDVAGAQGNLVEARRRHEEALAARRAGGDLDAAAFSLFNLGETAYLAGRLDDADRLLDEALTTFRAIDDRLGIGYALDVLGRVALARGEQRNAAQRFAEAMAVRRAIGDRRGQIECLEGIAEMTATLSDADTAARLFGCASALRTRLNAPLRPVERARHERVLASARRALSSDRFAKAWSAGAALSWDAAAEQAEQIIERTLTSPASPRPAAGASADTPLTTRELDVLRLVAAGSTDREIAERLFISRRTATTHVTNILNKLGVDNRAAAAAYAVRQGVA